MIKIIIQIIEALFLKKVENRESAPPEPPKKKGVIKYKNDSSRLSLEFNALAIENRELYNIIVDLSQFMMDNYNKELVITMINRTKAEQDAIYAGKKSSDGREYDKTPWVSPHQLNHAVDVRSRDMNSLQIRETEDYLNAKYNPENSYRWTAKCHDVGLGNHYHIQFARKK